MTMLHHAFLALALSLSGTTNVAGQVYYPDWSGGTGTCLSDGNESIDMINGGFTRTTIEACCADYYGWTVADECQCLELGGGTACTGTSKWYVDYENSKCVQDCPEGGALCGGLAEATVTLFADEVACCAAKLPSIAAGKCEADSLGNVYSGSNAYYVNYEDTNCVQDCDGAAPCGGIIVDNTPLFADVPSCCSGMLSYVDSLICEALSDPASDGTGKFFADQESKMCILDSTACKDTFTCARADASTSTLYDDAATCCAQGLTWVESSFCESLTTGVRSDKWFVDYDNEVCVNDCTSGDAWCVDITTLETPPKGMYDTVLECCEKKLSWVKPSTTCEALSKHEVPTGSNEWYVDYENDACVQDCDLSVGAPCGGLATTQDLFVDAATCCSTKLPYVVAGLCEANSAGTTYAGTNKFYVNYEGSNCLQDCDPATPPCGGIIEDAQTALFVDVATCCAENLSYVDADLCAALSDLASTGTGKFFVDAENAMCIKDTDSCSGTYTCARADPSTGTLYADEATCCSEGLNYVDTDYCVALTQGVPSDKWVADYENLVCVKDCAVGSSPECVDITTLSQTPTNFYDTSLECCESKLSWTDAATCDAVSQQGVDNYAGSDKWFMSGDVCVQDCDAATGAPCGGILPLGDKTPLYPTTAECCATAWYDNELCEAISTGAYTDKFFVKSDGVCAQDCAVGALPCDGNPTDLSSILYGTIEECCATFAHFTEDECVSASTGASATGSTDFYVDWTKSQCVQDCVGAAPCGGIKKSWTKVYPTANDCCKKLTWVHPDNCVATV